MDNNTDRESDLKSMCG